MTTIILLRHGNVENPKQILYGSLKGFHLSDVGRERVGDTALRMKSSGLVFDHIISSPLLRARETAGIVAAESGLSVVFDERLREWGMGGWEGQSLQKFYAECPYYKEPMSLNVDMEPLEVVSDRVLSCIRDVVKRFVGKNVLLVGHREPFVSAMLKLQGETWENIHNVHFPTASYWKLEFSDTGEFMRLEKGE